MLLGHGFRLLLFLLQSKLWEEGRAARGKFELSEGPGGIRGCCGCSKGNGHEHPTWVITQSPCSRLQPGSPPGFPWRGGDGWRNRQRRGREKRFVVGCRIRGKKVRYCLVPWANLRDREELLSDGRRKMTIFPLFSQACCCTPIFQKHTQGVLWASSMLHMAGNILRPVAWCLPYRARKGQASFVAEISHQFLPSMSDRHFPDPP